MIIIHKLILPVIFILLAYDFWVSSEFKQIAAGVAIFLFGMLALEQGFRAFSGVFESPRTVAVQAFWLNGRNGSTPAD